VNTTQNTTSNKESHSRKPSESGTLFSRDIDYLRDLALLWPILFFSIVAVSAVFSQSDRQSGLICAILTIGALLLTKEKLLMFFGALGFCALRGVITLVLRPWSWPIFAATAITGAAFLAANRYWRKPRLAYQWPKEFEAVDVLVSFASICGALFLLYLIRKVGM
jgi:hypothetical protein